MFKSSPALILSPPLIQSVITPNSTTVFPYVIEILLYYDNFRELWECTNCHSVTITMHWILNRTVFCIYGKSIHFKSASPSFKIMTHVANLPHTCLTVSLRILTSQFEALSLLSSVASEVLTRDCLFMKCGHFGEMVCLGSLHTCSNSLRYALKTDSFIKQMN